MVSKWSWSRYVVGSRYHGVMSVRWRTDHVGYDGDFLYARFAVDQWQSPEQFLAALDGYLGIVRAEMVREFDRLASSREA